MLIIRPHHINCLFFFKGLGYNYEFTKIMNSIVSELRNNPNIKIKLVSHSDDICKACPNKSAHNICLSEDKVKLLDENTLKYYHLQDKSEYYFKDIISNIYENYDAEKFFNICSQCEWFKKGVCSKEVIPAQQKIWLKNK